MIRCFQTLHLNKTSVAKLTCLFLQEVTKLHLTLTWLPSYVIAARTLGFPSGKLPQMTSCPEIPGSTGVRYCSDISQGMSSVEEHHNTQYWMGC